MRVKCAAGKKEGQGVKRSLPASLTVEGSFVFPFVVLLLFSIMSLTFHLHNSVKAQADSLQLTEYRRSLVNMGLAEEDLSDCLERYIENHLRTGYLYANAPVIGVRDSALSFVRRETCKRIAAAVGKLAASFVKHKGS